MMAATFRLRRTSLGMQSDANVMGKYYEVMDDE
jgi:hypothetical protein